MNGIIHGCTHPSHMDISDVISERDMMLGIMHYLDRIITQIVKPRVSVYMAIDGVAPRAKLNQQRSRRFRSAKDMAEATKKGTNRGTLKNQISSIRTASLRVPSSWAGSRKPSNTLYEKKSKRIPCGGT